MVLVVAVMLASWFDELASAFIWSKLIIVQPVAVFAKQKCAYERER